MSDSFVTPWIVNLQAPLSMGFLEPKSDPSKRSVLHDLGTLVVIFGNGNPLQYSCLEDPRGGAAWWGHTESDMTEAT